MNIKSCYFLSMLFKNNCLKLANTLILHISETTCQSFKQQLSILHNYAKQGTVTVDEYV